jgi:hypothetical protein
MGRDKKQFSNVLPTLASMVKVDYGNRMQPINIEVRNSSAHYCSIEGEVDENSSYYDIKQFIQH